MNMKRLFAWAGVFVALATISAYPQGTFPPLGDDVTSSLGSFRINIAPQFQSMFANCPAYNATNNVLSSPTLYDSGTRIGRSSSINDGSTGNNSDVGGVQVGSALTMVAESALIPPPGFPCSGVSPCSAGNGTHEVHTEVRSLKMVDLGGSGAAVRAGIWYDSATQSSNTPSRISPGEVESQAGPNPPLNSDFPASSYFDVFAQVDLPKCGGFPGPTTLYNLMPLVVKNSHLIGFPPKVVYLHDASTAVPILFLHDNPGFWHKDDILGYFLLAGHGIGSTNSSTDVSAFNGSMSGQPDATCPYVPPNPPPPPPPPTPTPTPTGGGGGCISTATGVVCTTTSTAPRAVTKKP